MRSTGKGGRTHEGAAPFRALTSLRNSMNGCAEKQYTTQKVSRCNASGRTRHPTSTVDRVGDERLRLLCVMYYFIGTWLDDNTAIVPPLIDRNSSRCNGSNAATGTVWGIGK